MATYSVGAPDSKFQRLKVWLTRHFDEYRLLDQWTFFWRITFERLIVVTAVAVTLTLSGSPSGRDIEADGLPFFSYAIFAPVVETLLFQVLPISMGARKGWNFRKQIIVSTLLFGLAHFLVSFTAGVSAGLIGGFYFAFTYAHWRRKSSWQAYWITALSHSLHNIFIMIIVAVAS